MRLSAALLATFRGTLAPVWGRGCLKARTDDEPPARSFRLDCSVLRDVDDLKRAPFALECAAWNADDERDKRS